MRSHSLRMRLLAGAGLWISLALLIAGAAIIAIFAARVDRDRDQDLLANLDRVTASIAARKAPTALNPGLGDPRFDVPAGGRYWQVTDLVTGEIGQSRSLWDHALDQPDPGTPGTAVQTTAEGPQGQQLAMLTRDVLLETPQGNVPQRVSVAEDLALRGADIRQFSAEIAVALLAVGAALVLAGWLQVHLGLRPLRTLQRSVEEVARGRLRQLEGDYPSELQPLVQKVNALLTAHERSLGFARARADDLAHGLKTPLAVLGATAGRLRQQGDGANATVLELLGEEMTERIDYQLRLAQLRVRSPVHVMTASLDQALIRSVAVLKKTGRGADLFWQVNAEKCSVDIDPHDLLELVGVLLENATKWARTQVEITCTSSGGTAVMEVCDDGPGLSEEEIAKLGPRGKRLDEERSGSGFGIAIAREILEMNGGELDIGRSAAGGLRATVRLHAAPADSVV